MCTRSIPARVTARHGSIIRCSNKHTVQVGGRRHGSVSPEDDSMLTFNQPKDNVLDAIAALIGDRLSSGIWSNLRGHWFHLLKCADEYVGFTISTPIGPAETDWMIESVSVAKLSNQIARAVTWIDKHLDDGTVRILVDQRHHLHALTIDNGEQMWAVVADLPRKIPIRKRVIYPWTKLLDLLSQEPPVCGISARGAFAT